MKRVATLIGLVLVAGTAAAIDPLQVLPPTAPKAKTFGSSTVMAPAPFNPPMATSDKPQTFTPAIVTTNQSLAPAAVPAPAVALPAGAQPAAPPPPRPAIAVEAPPPPNSLTTPAKPHSSVLEAMAPPPVFRLAAPPKTAPSVLATKTPPASVLTNAITTAPSVLISPAQSKGLADAPRAKGLGDSLK